MANLRERKKLTTRRALSVAAVRLAVERGLANVRREDIAAAADVSLRTFTNYFASKEEAIVALGVDRGEDIADALLGRPQGELLADALTAAFLARYADTAEPDKEWLTRVRLIISAPELRGEYLKALSLFEESLAAAIAERTGTTGLPPKVLAAAVCGAERVAVTHWLDGDTTIPLREVLRDALDVVLR